MEKSSYTMAKFGLEAKEVMPKRDCGFYVKYIFLFTSLIQFLIILGLVLFMVYGNAQAGTDTHLRAMEEQVQSSYSKVIALSARNLNLTRTLNTTLKDKQGLQVVLQKVQKDLDKCNSTQGTNPIPKRAFPTQTILCGVGVIGGEGNHAPQPHAPLPPPPFPAVEKAQVKSQLDQTTLSMKELQESSRKSAATLSKVTQEQARCQEDLTIAKASYESTKTHMDLLKQECVSLRSYVSYTLQHISERLTSYSCKPAQDQFNWLAERIEKLFLRQHELESQYMGKSVCDMYLQQCHANCSREKQELEKRLQDAGKQVEGGQEERKKLAAEKERLSKELEEKGKVAAQAEYFKEQLNICLGSKV
ncbi:PLVAP protein, partial [Semnornis frantzii]|nr:PLVAP protein [Semnornis frantzii]